jgi:hypothetical protein
MVKKVDEVLRMTSIEAKKSYPNNYIIMRMDNMEDDIGTILYIGDTEEELQDVLVALRKSGNSNLCGILEGTNKQCTLGGVVVYA